MKKIITVFTIFIFGTQYIIAGNIDSTQNFTLRYNHRYLEAKSAFSVNKVANHYPKKLMQSVEFLLLASSLATYGFSEHYRDKYNNEQLIKYDTKSNKFRKYSKMLAISAAGTFVLDILLRKFSQRHDRIKFQFAYNKTHELNPMNTTTVSISYRF